jgi:hypothetical protein
MLPIRLPIRLLAMLLAMSILRLLKLQTKVGANLFATSRAAAKIIFLGNQTTVLGSHLNKVPRLWVSESQNFFPTWIRQTLLGYHCSPLLTIAVTITFISASTIAFISAFISTFSIRLHLAVLYLPPYPAARRPDSLSLLDGPVRCRCQTA